MKSDIAPNTRLVFDQEAVPSQITEDNSVTPVLSRSRLWFWGTQSVLSLLDQGLVSGAGFLLTFLLARWLDSASYGAFAIAFATVLFLSGFHNVLLLEPMSVMGPARYADRTAAYFSAQLKIHKILAAILTASLLFIALCMRLTRMPQDLVVSTAASAVALPFFLMLWLVRRMAYMVHKPSLAGWASAGYFILTLCGLLAFHAAHILSPVSAFFIMGGAGVLTAVLPLWKLGILSPKTRDLFWWKDIARENWAYGRWLILSTGLFSMAAQTQIYLTGGILGLGAAGVFRAMQVPSLLMTQVISAMGLLVLPTMAREFGLGRITMLRKKAIVVSAGISSLAVIYLFFLAVFSGPIEHTLYRDKFSAYTFLIPLLGIVPVCTAFALGFSMAVRAAQKPQFDLVANAIAAPVGLITAVIFIRLWGLNGAAYSLVAGFASYAAAFCWAFAKIRRYERTEVSV